MPNNPTNAPQRAEEARRQAIKESAQVANGWHHAKWSQENRPLTPDEVHELIGCIVADIEELSPESWRVTESEAKPEVGDGERSQKRGSPD